VATYARCGAIFNKDFIADLSSEKMIIGYGFDRVMAVILWPYYTFCRTIFCFFKQQKA